MQSAYLIFMGTVTDLKVVLKLLQLLPQFLIVQLRRHLCGLRGGPRELRRKELGGV